MKNLGSIGAYVFGLILCGSAATAQDFSRYRDFELGSAVAAVSMLTGVAESELKPIHQRPALFQQLTWRPRYGTRRAPAGDIESVEQMVFDFYHARLFRVTVAYDRNDLGTRIAAWGNENDSVALYRRATDATNFRLVMTAEPPDQSGFATRTIHRRSYQ